MPDLYQTTLNLSSPMLHLSGVTPPALAEQTVRQSQPPGFGLPGISMQGLPGFSGILPGTYDVYRRISAHPTIALVMGMVKAPIAGNSWKWTKRDAQVKDEWVQFVQTTMDPLRGSIVQDALHALEYGWAPFEKIWEKRNGYKILARLKPLNWDFTQVLIDDHGNVCGLINQPPGKPKTELLDGKYFIYHIDSEAGNPYGRSRHENVRKEWCEAEQIRQRMAQYMRKVAGIVVQLHYPEGTSKDPAGADRPNQWLAQEVLDAVSQGKSVMFPNGFADTTDIRMAYELAGKSQWNLSSFDPGHGDYAPGMKTILEYYDALLFRGWLRPERSGLESKHGSRADAQVHTDTGTLDCELIDRDLTEAINHGIVNDLLVLNFGEEARGAVYAESAPIENDSVDIYKTLVNTLLTNKETGTAVAKKIDIDGILDSLNVPVEAKQRGALADEINQETPATATTPQSPANANDQVLPLAGYDPEQARDASGKWTSEGGGAATTPSSISKSGLVIAPGSKVSMKSADENPNELFPSIRNDQGTNQNNQQYAVCFAKGTLVLMADGTTKPIETIKAGESVLAAPENDPEDKPIACKVVEVYHNAPARLLAVTIASPIDRLNDEVIRATAGHKFHVKDKGWTQAEELKVGDELWTAEGTWTQVLSVADTGKTAPVYNLQIEHFHTYFVALPKAGSSVLVHNDSNDPLAGLTPLDNNGLYYRDIDLPGVNGGSPRVFRQVFKVEWSGKNLLGTLAEKLGALIWFSPVNSRPTTGYIVTYDEQLSHFVDTGPNGNYNEDLKQFTEERVAGIHNAGEQVAITAGEVGELIDAYFTATMVVDGAEVAALLTKAGYKIVVDAAGKKVLSLAGKELTEDATKVALEGVIKTADKDAVDSVPGKVVSHIDTDASGAPEKWYTVTNADGTEPFSARIIEENGVKRVEVAWTESLPQTRNWLGQIQEAEGGVGSIQQITGKASAGLEQAIKDGRMSADTIAQRLDNSLGGKWTVQLNTSNGITNIVATRN